MVSMLSSLQNCESMFFKQNIDYKVAKIPDKNSFESSEISDLNNLLSGSTAVAVAYDEPVSPAKVIKEFNKDFDLPHVKGILFEGQYFEGEHYKNSQTYLVKKSRSRCLQLCLIVLCLSFCLQLMHLCKTL